ncbi:MAG: 50S ribosomal protein L3 [Candidatus Bipolaricaulota bacterium]|nr:50S ribosomal protein L3 [Candidatus Bipolaricaulota bacterium]MDW8140718.1 50S ribosomal protein L3 [Candidatus Bipolaricaulota bacterium]
MALGILGKKLGMMTWFDAQGRALAATVVHAAPSVITQVKTPETDGYSAIQIGYDTIKEKNITKPLKGHFNKAGVPPKRILREFRLTEQDVQAFKVGQELNLTIFQEGEQVDVSGISKGKGFAGVMKRHDFKGGPDSHGMSGWHRRPGTIGSIRATGRTFKGWRMAGHMGHERVTVKNLVILKIDPEKNLLVLRGAIPGPRKGVVEIRKRPATKNG